ncbi:hypothetical protein SEA_ENYGMA_216 [Streptomyces phage Enygma]
MYPNPENFEWISVEPRQITIYGEIGPYDVIGNNRTGLTESHHKVIKSGFGNKQVAQKWMDLYIERYVKEHHFPRYLEGPEFECLDRSD